MSINPFEQKPEKLDKTILDWKKLQSKPYDKNAVDPYTKCRIVLMNGTEFEAVWHSHSFSRHCNNNDLRRELAFVRRSEQQQQKAVAALKPLDENQLEHTITYEQLAVDLTAELAKREKDMQVKAALDFALLEDFDHLYRYADLMESEQGILAERLVGNYTEIMPARPTVAHHRHPFDEIKRHIGKNADLSTKLAVNIITAAEQQTMNYYMNLGNFYPTDAGRRLYTEIGMVEEAHVSQYGSLLDTDCTWLEGNLMHEFVESYLYYSCWAEETDPAVKKLWEQFYNMEVAHLHKAKELLQKYENKEWQQVIGDGVFPAPLSLHSNKDYVRKILKNTVNLTANREDYASIDSLPDDFTFFRYQKAVNGNVKDNASHQVIERNIAQRGKDYRYEDSLNPIKALRNRSCDNIEVGRVKEAVEVR